MTHYINITIIVRLAGLIYNLTEHLIPNMYDFLYIFIYIFIYNQLRFMKVNIYNLLQSTWAHAIQGLHPG
jgi:hypothetical protein